MNRTISMRSISFVLLICFLMTAPLYGLAKINRDIKFDYAKYKYMVEKNPNDPWSHFNLAITFAYMGKVERGLEELGVVNELDKEFAPKAIDYFTRRSIKNPDDWKIRFRLAFAYYFDKQKDKALEELQKVIETKPITGKNAWAYGYKALIYGEQKLWDKAIEACEKGIRIEPEAAAIHLAHAQALYKKGNVLKAASEAFTAFRIQGEEKKYERVNKIEY